MKQKGLLLALLAVVLVVSLSLYGKKDAPPAPDLDTPVSDEDAVDSGVTSTPTSTTSGTTGTTGTPSADKLASLEQQNNSVLTTEELEELFEFGYKTEKYGRDNLDADTYNYYCDMFPKRSTGTQADAIAYGFIEPEVTNNSMYEGKTLPSDGFEQYVAWREATHGNASSSGNSQSAASNSSSQGQQGSSSSGNTNSGSNKGSGNTGSNGGNTSTGNDQQYGDVSGIGTIRTETPYYGWED